MEILTEGKHFRLVDDTELPEILKYLEQFLPESLKFHQTIRTYLNDRVWKFYFYVTKDWPDRPVCLHFPGCTLTPNNNIYESFGIFCPANRYECIDLLRTEDILLDWKKTLYLNFTHKDIINQIELFYLHGNGGTIDKLEGDVYVLEKLPEDLQAQELQSDEVEMRPLTTENVKVIHDLYPASEIESVDVFEKLIRALPGVGVFRKDTGEIAAWMVHSYYGAMFSMQTRPEFRRKGYGIHLAKSLTIQVIQRGYRPFVVIRPENEASRNLYSKLGFKKAYQTVRVTLKPQLLQFSEHHVDHNVDNINEIEILQRGVQGMCKRKDLHNSYSDKGTSYDKLDKGTNGIATTAEELVGKENSN